MGLDKGKPVRHEIPDQKLVWEEKHGARQHEALRHTPSPLAELAEPMFPRRSRILDLGCGVGRDAEAFAKKGHRILAADVSKVAIEQNRQIFTDSGIEFRILDMRDPLPYAKESFDVVYANLSLHYYSDQKTREVVKEIARVLKPSGTFAFACKSYDNLHNSGTEIEKNIFVSGNGVVIHLFSKDYARYLVNGLFAIEFLDEVDEEYNGRYSKIVRCVAKKSAKTGASYD